MPALPSSHSACQQGREAQTLGGARSSCKRSWQRCHASRAWKPISPFIGSGNKGHAS